MTFTSSDFTLDKMVSERCGGGIWKPPDAIQLGFSFRAGEKQMRQGFIVRNGMDCDAVAKVLRDAAEWLEWFGKEEYVAMYPDTARELGLSEVFPSEPPHEDFDD